MTKSNLQRSLALDLESKRPHLDQVLDVWAQHLDPSSTVALREVWDARTELADLRISVEQKELWSKVRVAWNRLDRELEQRWKELDSKWISRFEAKELGGQLAAQGLWSRELDGSWCFAGRGASKETRNIFKVLIHNWIKDAEKEWVYAEARVRSVQDFILKEWTQLLAGDDAQKLVAILESCMRPGEQQWLRQGRENLDETLWLMRQAHWRRSCARSYESPEIALESLGVLADASAHLRGVEVTELHDWMEQRSRDWLKWHRDKWNLYLRGIAPGGQL